MVIDFIKLDGTGHWTMFVYFIYAGYNIVFLSLLNARPINISGKQMTLHYKTIHWSIQ